MLGWMLRAVMRNLIVEDELAPGSAIVVLGGGHPHREVGAADLYRRGLAPRVVLVRSYWSQLASDRLLALGVCAPDDGHLRRQLLRALGVPDSAIVMPDALAHATEDELAIALDALATDDGPVILVSSKYHTRRIGLCWQRLTGGRPPAIVHGVAEPQAPLEQWWRSEPVVLSVAQEYYGLARQMMRPPRPRGEREEMRRALVGALEELRAADPVEAHR